MNVLIIPFIKYSQVDTKLGSMLHDYILSKLSKFPVDNFVFNWNIHGLGKYSGQCKW